MSKIYLWATNPYFDEWRAYAMNENGEALEWHTSSNLDWAKHDIGLTSERKHDAYKAKHPEGYQLIWVDDPEMHDGFRAAWALHIAAQKAPDAQ